MAKIAFINANIYNPELISNHVLLVEDSKIVDLVSQETYQAKYAGQYIEKDCQGLNLLPGFIDLQVNGCGGFNFNETEANLSLETLKGMLESNLKHGTTSYLPTLITSPIALRKKALATVKQYLEASPEAQASIPGIHIEGPHISLVKKGTHNPNFIKEMTAEDQQLYLEYADIIKTLTLAPEVNDLALVKPLIDAGVIISIGHTNATAEEAIPYIQAGARTATHLFNAMTSLSNGRTPGVVGTLYDNENIYSGIITDGVHVDWANVRTSFKQKPDHLYVVTDAVTPAGTDITEFEFASKIIKVIDEGCYDEFGSLSGSAITMDSALRRLMKNTGFGLEQVVKHASVIPAKVIGMADQIGSLKPNTYANLILTTDELEIKETYLTGKLVYTS